MDGEVACAGDESDAAEEGAGEAGADAALSTPCRASPTDAATLSTMLLDIILVCGLEWGASGMMGCGGGGCVGKGEAGAVEQSSGRSP